ncbi:MAG: DUF167 domain-containing protein [Nanoarchaeota archaeon]
MRVIEVIVKPRAKRTEILQESETQLKIAIKAPPEDNKANLELIKFLSKQYRCKVEIIKGHTSKKKLIRLVSEQNQADS